MGGSAGLCSSGGRDCRRLDRAAAFHTRATAFVEQAVVPPVREHEVRELRFAPDVDETDRGGSETYGCSEWLLVVPGSESERPRERAIV